MVEYTFKIFILCLDKGYTLLYGVRFNGKSVGVYKYKVFIVNDDVIELYNITPGVTTFETHKNDRVAKSHIGNIHEQYNAYIVYIESLDEVSTAIEILTKRITADKRAYLEAVKTRIKEFNAQIAAVQNADLTVLDSLRKD